MRPESVAQNLLIEPSPGGETTWEEDILTLTFIPDQPWPSGETITVILTTGARSSLGLSLAEPETWYFITVTNRLLAYLWPSDSPADIYTLAHASGEIIRMTETENGVDDFSISADGSVIYYSAQNASGGSDIMGLDLLSRETSSLLECGRALCQVPRKSPIGNQLAYENATDAQIWLLPSSKREPVLIGNSQLPSWSPDGLLSFYDVDQQAFLFYNPDSEKTKPFQNQTGELGTWSPDGDTFIAPEITSNATADGLPTSHLIGFSYDDSTTTDLTKEDDTENTSPAFSPNGSLVAFARKFLDPDRWTPGRQLWLMNPDGENAHPLTDAPFYNHSAFAWSPDENQIAYVRSNQATLSEPPEIWLINVDGSEATRLVIGGYSPQWLP